jgi:hypothetical protein
MNTNVIQAPESADLPNDEDIDINHDLDNNIHHIRSLMQAPLHSDKQQDYTVWH